VHSGFQDDAPPGAILSNAEKHGQEGSSEGPSGRVVCSVRSSWKVLKDRRVARAGARPRGGKGWRRPPGRTGRQRLTKEQALEIRRRVAAGESRRALAAAFSVSEDTIGSIAAGHTWRRA
jgi:hypothetical protein